MWTVWGQYLTPDHLIGPFGAAVALWIKRSACNHKASTKRVIGGVRKGIRPENANQSPLSRGTVLSLLIRGIV
jgi:hypothetical protein